MTVLDLRLTRGTRRPNSAGRQKGKEGAGGGGRKAAGDESKEPRGQSRHKGHVPADGKSSRTRPPAETHKRPGRARRKETHNNPKAAREARISRYGQRTDRW